MPRKRVQLPKILGRVLLLRHILLGLANRPERTGGRLVVEGGIAPDVAIDSRVRAGMRQLHQTRLTDLAPVNVYHAGKRSGKHDSGAEQELPLGCGVVGLAEVVLDDGTEVEENSEHRCEHPDLTRGETLRLRHSSPCEVRDISRIN
jgi:hypothetical protein